MFAIKLLVSPKFLAGAAVGYLLGARAGREQYDRLLGKVEAAKGRLMHQVRGQGSQVVDRARERGAEMVETVKDKIPVGAAAEESGSGSHARSGSELAAQSAVSNGHPMHASGRG